ncbi:MAG: hypothetical protein JSS76_07060 [Bacteroidetes bacterium]|nr:hypothetical protein [Bacteroidota bacterium]
MAGTIGNINAAKWTRDLTWSYLDRIEDLAWDESITTLSQALLRVRCYKQLWSYWKKKWEQDGDIMDRIYYIEEIFTNKLEEAALYRRLHPSACYFILRYSYGYNTRGERELPAHLRAEFEEPASSPAETKTQPDRPSKQPAADKISITEGDMVMDQELRDTDRSDLIRSAALQRHGHRGVVVLQE